MRSPVIALVLGLALPLHGAEAAPAPLRLTPAWQAQGEPRDGLAFGTRAMAAGDINGDGFDDLVVGDPLWGGQRGKAYIFLGSAKGLGPHPAWTLAGEAKDERFGDRVGQAGDVNGDGYDDIFVAAPGWKGGLGRCVVFYGSAKGLAKAPDWSVSPESAGEQFGDCTHPTGDLNGDGYDDLAVGGFSYDKSRGRVRLYQGSRQGLGSRPVWEAQGEGEGDWFGYGIGTAGDVNGDGIDDLLAGAKYNKQGGPDAGKAYLYEGSKGALGKAAWTWEGSAHANASLRICTAGDVNGDGYDDVLVTAPGVTGTLGELDIFFGSAGGLGPKPDQVFHGPEWGLIFFGQGACPVGDVLGDGYTAVAVAGRDRQGLGKVLVFRGSAQGLEAQPSWEIDGTVGGSTFGQWIAPAGDLDGDGLADLVISADSPSPGHLYVVYGRQFRASLGAAAPKRVSRAKVLHGYLWKKSTKNDIY
jgi:hypothetical protein